MKKVKISIIILIFTLLPSIGSAQLDFNLDDLLMDETVNNNVIIRNFELIWSVDTYTPYEYQGRALPIKGSRVLVEAIVSVSNGDTRSLKYSWFLEDIFQVNKSGYGKNSFSFYVNKIPGSIQTIRVQVFNEDRSVFEEKSIKIPVVEPEIVVYPLSENSRFSDQAAKSFFVASDKKLSLITKPYFFSIKKLTDLSFTWQFANQESITSSIYDANVLNLIVANKEDKEISENNLYYYRARYYSPLMQRFINEDPIRHKSGNMNFYAYVKDNPENLTDPLGLYGCQEILGMKCKDCHKPHIWKISDEQAKKTCVACHEYRGPKAFLSK